MAAASAAARRPPRSAGRGGSDIRASSWLREELPAARRDGAAVCRVWGVAVGADDKLGGGSAPFWAEAARASPQERMSQLEQQRARASWADVGRG